MVVNIGKNIRKYRKEKNLTQAELASKVFISRQTLSRIEREEKMPSFLILTKIAHALDVFADDLCDIMDSEGNMIPNPLRLYNIGRKKYWRD